MSYDELLQFIANHYDSNVDELANTLKKYNVYGNYEKTFELLDGQPYYLIKNADGSVRGIGCGFRSAPLTVEDETALSINSNLPIPAKNESVHMENIFGAEQTGKTNTAGEKEVNFGSGFKSAKTGEAVSKSIKFTLGDVVAGIGAAATGITLGKTIDSLLYNANPDFWEDHNLAAINPDTWNSITSDDDSIGSRIFNMVFGIDSDNGNAQAYMDENALAYYALYLQQNGAFTRDTTEITDTPFINVKNYVNFPIIRNSSPFIMEGPQRGYNIVSSVPFSVFYDPENTSPWAKVASIFASNVLVQNCYGYSLSTHPENSTPTLDGSLMMEYTYEDKTVYYGSLQGGNASYNTPNQSINRLKTDINISQTQLINEIAWTLIYGTQHSTGGVEGIDTQDDAKTPDLNGVTTDSEALQQLKEQFPELWDNAITQEVAQPDGSSITYTYVPVAMPNISSWTDTQPTSGTSTQQYPATDPKTATDSELAELVALLSSVITKTPTTNPPDTGGGDTPPIVPVSGSASSLWAIYNPTLAQINDFGAWLWSDNFVEQIKKLFNDPMQSIIGLHRVYATPATGGTRNIKVGYLDSGVASKYVSDQYTTINCGTVNLREYFNNVFDYSPYTQVQLYLPFIGIVSLDVADVMRSSISVTYKVDVLTGACLAMVNVIRDGAGGVLYQYAGNAAVTMPISSGSYMGIVASLASIAGGVASTIASGGAAAPMAIGAVGGALNARTKVEHSGSFSGNAGAMGCKIPYLIISRPQTALADNYSAYIGNPANHTTTLGNCSGYVKVTECHLENIPATREELNSIESILKGGVLI